MDVDLDASIRLTLVTSMLEGENLYDLETLEMYKDWILEETKKRSEKVANVTSITTVN